VVRAGVGWVSLTFYSVVSVAMLESARADGWVVYLTSGGSGRWCCRCWSCGDGRCD
jgi:hypothetical protein